MPGKRNINGVREILLRGIFWRILFIEAVLLIFSLFYRWLTEDAGPADLLWYALRIVILVGVIILFMMVTLKKFLTEKIILPLEALDEANRRTQKDYSRANEVELPENTPHEILSIVRSRAAMLSKILTVSEERLNLVNFIRDTFGRYLSKKVVNQILTSPKGRQIGGSRKEVTVLMSDLRGFTNLSETRDPEEMVQLLNQYLEKMSSFIIKYDGIIDEIIGDAILAVFGAPDSHDNDPERAIACAIEMQNCLGKLNEQIMASGFPPLEMGIGINTGQVIVGNIGSDVRMKYGIVGEPVNRASRIESNSTGGQILIGQSTYTLVQDKIKASPPRTTMMKGMKKPLIFYSVTGIKSKGILADLTPLVQAHCFSITLPFQCWNIQGKRINSTPISGETVSMDENNIYAVTNLPLPLFADVRLRFDFCIQAHCFEDIHAKHIKTTVRQNRPVSQFRITAMGEKDKYIIQQWMMEASG